MRIVLDTNILVSALIAGCGPPGQLLAEVKRGRVRLVTSAEQIAELRRVLHRPHLRRHISAAAVAGRADLIVSGDKKHMLALEQAEGIPIVKAPAAAGMTHRPES